MFLIALIIASIFLPIHLFRTRTSQSVLRIPKRPRKKIQTIYRFLRSDLYLKRRWGSQNERFIKEQRAPEDLKDSTMSNDDYYKAAFSAMHKCGQELHNAYDSVEKIRQSSLQLDSTIIFWKKSLQDMEEENRILRARLANVLADNAMMQYSDQNENEWPEEHSSHPSADIDTKQDEIPDCSLKRKAESPLNEDDGEIDMVAHIKKEEQDLVSDDLQSFGAQLGDGKATVQGEECPAKCRTKLGAAKLRKKRKTK
jgi:hypothetical protein